jgi:hypothetical protein
MSKYRNVELEVSNRTLVSNLATLAKGVAVVAVVWFCG